MAKNRNRIYSNGEITIVWQANECTHSTICYTRLRSVFDPIKRPWINPQGASTIEIIKIIESCPSMALQFYWNDDNRNENETSTKLFKGDIQQLLNGKPNNSIPSKPSTSPTIINIRANGPVVISGEFNVIGADGKPMAEIQMISICRCGHSGNMPHCDGTHFKIGFKSN